MTFSTEPPEALDVRSWVPIDRHTNLLRMFKELPVGQSFVFINDHDPLPLYYEFRSVHGDVVGWEYLKRGGTDWKVKVTRTEASQGREFTDISTLMDLRKMDPKDWKRVVFHRYGMMQLGDVMEIIAEEDPKEIHAIFAEKFAGKHTWTNKKSEPGEYVIHLTRNAKDDAEAPSAAVVKEFDARPFPPAERHERVFHAFDALKTGQAFVFTNDHDPKPLYYQLEAESLRPFLWEYLESGPEVWKVRVARLG